MTESRFETSPEQIERNRRGIELCRQQLTPPAPREQPEPATRSDRIRAAALEMAAAQRRDRRLEPTPLGRIAGQALTHIRRNPR